MIEPFRINISNQTIENIYDKIKKYPWNEMPDINGWDHGTNFSYIKEISKQKLRVQIFIILRKKVVGLILCLYLLCMDGLVQSLSLYI